MSERKTFKIRMSERCFRFKPDALDSHAPPMPGVYEFVVFDAQLKPEVIYVGLSSPQGLREALAAHLMGNKRPTGEELFRISKDVYFDYVMPDCELGPEDLRDIAAALVLKNKPRLGDSKATASGRYSAVELVEID